VKISLLLTTTFVALFSAAALSQVKSGSITTKNTDYIEALSVADQFMRDWQWRDQDDGFSLISDSLKSKESEDDLRMYISGLSNPHHEAYEIYSGSRLPDGRISFKVKMYESYTSYPNVYSEGPTTIIISKSAQGKWLVDKLP